MEKKQEILLVSAASNLEKIPEQRFTELEPVFLVSKSTELRFPEVFHPSMMDYFCHCVARDPGDLRSHIRRIFLAYEYGPAGDLFAALVDLFIALGCKGAYLKRRMLENSKARLDRHVYELLRGQVSAGPGPVELPFVPGSLLSQGIEGSLKCVFSGPERTAAVRDPLTEAREYLEYSNLDEARRVLEEAVLEHASSPELHRELLGIYRSTRDSANFLRIFRAMDRMNNPVPEEWAALAEFFGISNV